MKRVLDGTRIQSNQSGIRELNRLSRLEMGELVSCSKLCSMNSGKRTYLASIGSGPTNYLPGTIGKIEVMRVRVAMGYSPFHYQDARLTLI